MKNVVILGSTGSIGINTLKVIKQFPRKFRVIGLTAFNNLKLLEEQTRAFSPTHIAVGPEGIGYFKKQAGFTHRIKILNVLEDLEELVARPEVDIVVVGMRGSGALKPFLSAVRAGKRVAPANKEALVIAGDILMREAAKYKAEIIPVDSEQSAIFQCLQGQKRSELSKIYLTASGGPLGDIPKSQFDKISVKKVLNHPRWKMGKKITVDSATLMNKGFEVIEAVRLFNVRAEQIQVLIHPEAVIHSMVGFKDGSVIAQLGITDMRLPIQYALTYPERIPSGLKAMDFFELKQLSFKKPDMSKFPALGIAFQAAQERGTMPCVLNAADEEAVEAFLNGRLLFSEIIKVVEKVLGKHKNIQNPGLDQIFATDQWAREEAQRFISKY